MRVIRGRAADPDADHRRTAEIVDRVAETGEPAVRVWTPRGQVVFGRRDARSDGYERARAVAADLGYTPLERDVGGRAVAYTGSTVAFALVESVDDHRTGIRARYDRVLDTLRSALTDCGVAAECGEPPNSFCPGSHSLQIDDSKADDGKVVGVAQRVRQEVAVTAGVVVVRDHETVGDVLDPIYDHLGVPFDRASVGSLAAVGGTTDPESVIDAVEASFADGHETRVTSVRET